MLVDSTFDNVGTAIYVATEVSGPASGSTGISLSNVAFNSVSYGILDTAGNVLLPSSITYIDTLNAGNIYAVGFYDRFSQNFFQGIPRDQRLLASGTASGRPHDQYFTRSRPEHADLEINFLVQAKWVARGMWLCLLRLARMVTGVLTLHRLAQEMDLATIP